MCEAVFDDAASLKTASHTLKSCLAYVATEDDVKLAATIEADSKQPSQISLDQIDKVDKIAGHWIECVQVLREETAEVVAGSS